MGSLPVSRAGSTPAPKQPCLRCLICHGWAPKFGSSARDASESSRAEDPLREMDLQTLLSRAEEMHPQIIKQQKLNVSPCVPAAHGGHKRPLPTAVNKARPNKI